MSAKKFNLGRWSATFAQTPLYWSVILRRDYKIALDVHVARRLP